MLTLPKIKTIAVVFFAIFFLFIFILPASGYIVYVGNFKDNTVSAVDTDNGAVIAVIPVESGPHGMCLSSDGKMLFVSNDGSSNISVIDTTANKISGSINVGKSPHGLALTPDGKTLLVCVNGDDNVSFVDVNKLEVVSSVHVGKPHTISIRPDGKIAYVSSQETGNFKLAAIDLKTLKVVKTVKLEKTPRDLEFSYDGKVILFTEAGINAVQILNPANDKIIGEIPTGASPHYVNILKNAGAGMAVVQGPGEILLFDPVTFKPGIKIKVGDQPHWLAVSTDGKTAFVTNEASNTISVIDIKSGKVTGTIPVGNQPRKIVVQNTVLMTTGAKVTINNFAFIPNVAKINAGESIIWSNKDGSFILLHSRMDQPVQKLFSREKLLSESLIILESMSTIVRFIIT